MVEEIHQQTGYYFRVDKMEKRFAFFTIGERYFRFFSGTHNCDATAVITAFEHPCGIKVAPEDVTIVGAWWEPSHQAFKILVWCKQFPDVTEKEIPFLDTIRIGREFREVWAKPKEWKKDTKLWVCPYCWIRFVEDFESCPRCQKKFLKEGEKPFMVPNMITAWTDLEDLEEIKKIFKGKKDG